MTIEAFTRPITLRVNPAIEVAMEANHRIANNLSLVAGMVRMHTRKIMQTDEPMDSVEVCALLDEISGHIDGIARLHGLLAAGQNGSIDLSDYLNQVATTVVSSISYAGKARLTHWCEGECLINAERAVTIGLIVGELVTNSLKYAHPSGTLGAISVGCIDRGDGIEIDVTDDGVGLPDDFDPRMNGGLGLRLAHSLTDQLSGRLSFEDSGVGLTVLLRVPS